MPQPKILGLYAGKAEGNVRRETEHIDGESVNQLLEGMVLTIGADVLFSCTPQVINGVEVRAALGEPEQVNAQVRSGSERSDSRMAGVFIQEKNEVLVSVLLAQVAEERLKILSPLSRSGQQDTMAGVRVECAKNDRLGIPAGEHDLGLLAPMGPGRTQRRKDEQVGFILKQHHRLPFPEEGEGVLNPAFFSLALGRARGRSEVASRRSSTVAVPAGGYGPKALAHPLELSAPAIEAQSIRWVGTQRPRVTSPELHSGDPQGLPSTSSCVLVLAGLGAPRSHVVRMPLPSCKGSADEYPTSGRRA